MLESCLNCGKAKELVGFYPDRKVSEFTGDKDNIDGNMCSSCMGGATKRKVRIFDPAGMIVVWDTVKEIILK
jgi:hypothetical protein